MSKYTYDQIDKIRWTWIVQILKISRVNVFGGFDPKNVFRGKSCFPTFALSICSPTFALSIWFLVTCGTLLLFTLFCLYVFNFKIVLSVFKPKDGNILKIHAQL